MNRFILLCASLLFGIAPLWSVPARPVSTKVTQPDGSVITVRTVGDEYHHYRVTADGVPVVRGNDGFFRYAEWSSRGVAVAGKVVARDAEFRTDADKAYLSTLANQQVSQRLAQRKSSRKEGFQRLLKTRQNAPAAGEVHGLVLMVQFKDKKFSSVGTQAGINDMMNKSGYNYNGAIGSARDYFIDQSFGQFQPTFDVIGPITLDNNMAYYGGNDSYGDDLRPREMVVEACQKAEDLVDFTIYDRDNDGFVDLVYVLYAGYGESSDVYGDMPETIWPHAWAVYSSSNGITAKVDGKQIDLYACSSELEGTSGTIRDGIGTFCHEYSHTLGLADYYDTMYGENYGMGTWSLMDTGCYNGEDFNGTVPAGYSAYDREACGWMTIEELNSPASITLENIADSKKAYKITSNDPNQYFTLENRQQTGWDSYLAASGLMILKVDYDEEVWEYNEVNNTSSRQRMTIMPADNSLDLYDEEGDLYPYGGNNSFTSTSRPASKTNTAGTIDKPVTNISKSGKDILFDFMGGKAAIDAPIAEAATEITSSSFTAHWSSVADATGYILKVDRKLPTQGGEILLSEDFSDCTKASTANIGGTTSMAELKEGYTQLSGWSGKYLYPEVGMMKLGNSSNGGTLRTPAIDLSECDGTFTVTFNAQMYSSTKESSVVIKVYLDGQESNAKSTAILSADEMNSYSITLTGGTANSKIVLESTAASGKKRAYLTDIVVYSGEVDANAALLAPAEENWPLVITLTETSYTVSGLSPEYTYSYQVKAINADGEESKYSNTVKVELSTGIDQLTQTQSRVFADGNAIIVESETEQPVVIVNVAGQTVVSTTVAGHAQLNVPAAGLYIVRCGASVTRVIVQ